jgi:predicted RNA-binding Zn-ribbon protein involved in translation (DUF1610 family)
MTDRNFDPSSSVASKHIKYKEVLQLQNRHRGITMAEKAATLSFATCTSCGKPIPPGAESTKFLCPNCGEIQIRRCAKCRKFGRAYKCPKCGYIFP